MTDFGRLLGTGNGMAMLGALLPDATKEQAKAVVGVGREEDQRVLLQFQSQ